MHAMALRSDRQLAEFFDFLGHQIGWRMSGSRCRRTMALPLRRRLPPRCIFLRRIFRAVNTCADQQHSHSTSFAWASGRVCTGLRLSLIWVNEDVFAAAKMKEADAERRRRRSPKTGWLARILHYVSQLAKGDVPNTEVGLRVCAQLFPIGGWYVIGVPVPFKVGIQRGTDHASPYTYDTHVPLAFYGIPFQPGTYRGLILSQWIWR